jgi:hypothetical protein
MTPEFLDQFRRPLILYPPGKDPNPPHRDVWRAEITDGKLTEWVLGSIYKEENGKEIFVWVRDRPRPLSRWERFKVWWRYEAR